MISGGCILNMIITCVAEEDDEEPDALNDIVSRMRDLASNRGDAQRRSKKDRAYLKQTFREHYKAVEVIAPFSTPPPLPPPGGCHHDLFSPILTGGRQTHHHLLGHVSWFIRFGHVVPTPPAISVQTSSFLVF